MDTGTPAACTAAGAWGGVHHVLNTSTRVPYYCARLTAPSQATQAVPLLQPLHRSQRDIMRPLLKGGQGAAMDAVRLLRSPALLANHIVGRAGAFGLAGT